MTRAATGLLVGLDFDNTIVCYDGLFHRLAHERGLLAANVPAAKGPVRDHLRRIGREDDWTELQGIAYGPRIVEAAPFPGIKEFLGCCVERGVRVAIVSHKTKHPYLGEPHDLHAAAHNFLEAHGFYDTAVTGLSRVAVHLELSKTAKLARIGTLGCDIFVDDLPEFLAEPGFPCRPRKILFDPGATCPDDPSYCRVRSWAEVRAVILGEETRVA